jgi:hypothetical protein
MTSIEFSQRFFRSDPGSPEAAALARDLVEEARYPANHAIDRYLSVSEEPARMKAKNILAELREAAIVPLAESAPAKEFEDEIWAMRTMTEELMDFRLRAATVLQGLLSNRQPANPTPEGSSYQTPPGARVCDLAYILLHRMLRLESSPSAYFGKRAMDRDASIKAFEKSREFRSTFDPKS